MIPFFVRNNTILVSKAVFGSLYLDKLGADEYTLFSKV
jgi:hypothetical protein